MKKSWHPLLQKNQERVWQEENKAREERKRIDQKRKEIAEERQLQELQRLQESQGGKVRQERLDWMYAAPGSGGQSTSESLEAYLLGKKKVDDLITGDDNEKLKKGADAAGFIAMSNANNASDTRNKVFNDPLLAIKKQEQRKFEELMNNPIMLKKLKREMEKKDGKSRDKEDGEKRKHRHHRHRSSEKRHRHESPERHSSERRDTGYSKSRRREYEDRDYRTERSSRRYSSPRRAVESSASEEDSKSAALQAMLANAEDLESSRAERLAALEVKEKADEERERQERERTRGLGGRAGFVRDMQNHIIDEGLMMKVR